MMQDQHIDIPIDIHANKLLDWLVSRRHCNRDWQTKVLTIREKINNAIQDMPVHEGIAKLLSGSYINYFHCMKIIEILKETEASSKNFFGSYGSKRMKDWQEVVKLYEKDNVYLADAAQMLIRNVNYEVPSLRKQIAKCEQTQAECDKKEVEYGKSANVVRAEFQTLCKQLGIQGERIKRELVEKLDELPAIYSKIATNVKSLGEAVEFYVAFVKFVLGNEHAGGCVPVLKFMIKHGNTTTYEWHHGKPPLSIEEPVLNIELDDEPSDNADDAINFGDDSGGIDFGDANANEIDCSQITVVEADIDWTSTESNTQELITSTSMDTSGMATGKEALTLLDNPKTRNSFIDELMELEAFLKMRLYEMRGANDLLTLSQLQEASAVLQLQTTESVAAMLARVGVVLKEVTDQRTQHLHNVKNSPRYVDHLANSLKQKLTTAEKMVASQEVVRQRRADAGQEARDIEPKVKLIIVKTKELQTQIEKDISEKYKNRPVNLMGGVNTM